jgi:hypothetical protein
MRWHALAWFVGLSLFFYGCGQGDQGDRPAVHPVTGKLLVDGKPAGGAQVALRAIDKPELNKFYPHAVAEPDGSFRLTTFNIHDGAPRGEFAVVVVWPGPRVAGQSEEEDGPDRLGRRFANPKRPAAKVRIDEQTKDLATIDLKTAR